MLDMAAEVKKVAKIPVIAVGKMDIPELAEEAIAEGKADMVAIGRGLLADPQWAAKAASGCRDDIRPCIGCHDGCIGRFLRGKPLCCAVNPACGREKEYELQRVGKPGMVMVIGGGVAGMEAARVAALRGHSVTLYEKSSRLGGHLWEAAVPGFKADLTALLHWYQKQLKTQGVSMNLNTEATEKLVNEEKPDTVVIATGSTPSFPDIPGVESANVVSCIDILQGKKIAGDKMAVIGGGLVGCEIALWLAQNRREVTVIEVLPELMSGGLPVPQMNKTMLLDLLALNRVKIMTATTILEINPQGLRAQNKANQISVEVDTIVLAAGLKSNSHLYQTLAGKIPHIYAIGDCREPRNIMGAIWDGYEVGRAI